MNAIGVKEESINHGDDANNYNSYNYNSYSKTNNEDDDYNDSNSKKKKKRIQLFLDELLNPTIGAKIHITQLVHVLLIRTPGQMIANTNLLEHETNCRATGSYKTLAEAL